MVLEKLVTEAPQPGDGRSSSMSNAEFSKAMSSASVMGDFGSKEGSLKQVSWCSC